MKKVLVFFLLVMELLFRFLLRFLCVRSKKYHALFGNYTMDSMVQSALKKPYHIEDSPLVLRLFSLGDVVNPDQKTLL
jgi:hypothetical protein